MSSSYFLFPFSDRKLVCARDAHDAASCRRAAKRVLQHSSLVATAIAEEASPCERHCAFAALGGEGLLALAGKQHLEAAKGGTTEGRERLALSAVFLRKSR